MRAHSNLPGKHILHVAIVAACPLLTWFALDRGKMPTLAVVGLLAMVVGIYVGLRQPLWLYWGLAAVMGFLPHGYFPGVHLPLYLPFAAGVLLAALLHPTAETRLHPIEIAVVVLVIVAGVSVLATATNLSDVAEFIKWSLATLVLIALLRLSRENLIRFGRIFVFAATANALFGIVTVLLPGKGLIRVFSVFGYQQMDRFVFSNEGQSRSIRLGGLWIDPNGAGLALIFTFVIALVVLTGRARAAVIAILSIAILLTLSRAAIFSLLAGLLLVLVFHKMRQRDRQIAIGGIFLAVIVALLVPQIRNRIFSSFGSDDAGSSARWEALLKFPADMAGDWLFGKPWASPEFKSGEVAFKLNFAANAPLDSIYRGGIFVGLAFVTVLVMGIIMSFKAIRSDSLPAAIYGGAFIGLTLIAFQLDHPIVLISQTTLIFSVLLAFLVYVDRQREEASETPPPHSRRGVPPAEDTRPVTYAH
ncbi:O-antigen ligase domain-containing protein [Mycolicibacterium sp.]|uniref:O-antigen ligase family protein n=1 Tax=Mycolicibacterium sp. TaxID=2320850 RepID=UPI001A32700D|nr:O-antigen ligase domain-containing protein [Mycolicibacterium sp.]MBJ7339087.1 O-antigen ligase domain-containing protein [Mycolicibacterium sp.]